MTRALLIGLLIVMTSLAGQAQQGGRGRGPQGPPEITGTWTGTWSS